MIVKGRNLGRFDERIEEQFLTENVQYWMDNRLNNGAMTREYTMVVPCESEEEYNDLMKHFTDSQDVFIEYGYYAHTAMKADGSGYGVQIWMDSLEFSFNRAVERRTGLYFEKAFESEEVRMSLFQRFLDAVNYEGVDYADNDSIDHWFTENTICKIVY